MTEADIKIAAYQDAIEICKMVKASYGDLPGASCLTMIARLQDRIEEIEDQEAHKKVVEAL